MTETQLAEEVTDNQSLPEPSQSAEEKFLGVKSTVGTKRDSENIEIEIVDDRPEEDRKPPRNVSTDNNKEEMWVPTKEDIAYQDSMYIIIRNTQNDITDIKKDIVYILERLDYEDGSWDSIRYIKGGKIDKRRNQ